MGYTKDVDYKTEYHQGRWFIDFAFTERKIAIEIDGKQHELPERQIKDAEKDAWLIANGWTVHRIKWKRLTKEISEMLKNDIAAILTGSI